MKKRRRSSRRRKQKNVSGMLLCAILSVLAAVFAYQVIYLRGIYNEDAQELEGSDCPAEIQGIPVTTDFVPLGYAARTGTKRKIHYIVIHETDNKESTATAQAHNEYLHSYGKTHKLSWHYTVDENEIYHHIPDRETAFHAGDFIKREGGNRNGIGIELCVNKGSNFDTTLHNAAVLVAYLLDTYDLSIDDVKKHQDFSGKICPSTLIQQNRWDEFLTIVEQSLYDRKKQRNGTQKTAE